MAYQTKEIEDLAAENQKLWNANKTLAKSFNLLTSEIKRLKQSSKLLRETIEMWQRAENIAFSEIDEVLKKIDNLNEGRNYE